MPQVTRSPKVYDVCIIGSGAGGGTAAKVLTEGGLNVVMLEAGPLLNPRKDYKEHVWPYALPHRGADIGGRARHELNGEFLAPNGFWEIEGEPYTTAPGSTFRWFRSRIEGGRTNHYGRISLRVSQSDLKARSRDGLGDDWPITYEELSPYYDKVEEFIGVFGTKENLADAPDGVFLPPPKPRCTETLVKKACDHLNITCIPLSSPSYLTIHLAHPPTPRPPPPPPLQSRSFIGVFGSKENLADAPDGVFLPPPKPRCTETLVKKACDQLNITCIPSRMAMLTKSVNGRAALPLLCAVRTRMHQCIELQFQPGDDPTGPGHRAFHADSQRHGAGDRGRQRRQGASRLLHRQDHREQKCGCMPTRSWSPPALAKPRACCSIHAPRSFLMGWPIHPAYSAGI